MMFLALFLLNACHVLQIAHKQIKNNNKAHDNYIYVQKELFREITDRHLILFESSEYFKVVAL